MNGGWIYVCGGVVFVHIFDDDWGIIQLLRTSTLDFCLRISIVSCKRKRANYNYITELD